MAFARAVGEYGSVIFIAGNMPMVSEITPLIIIGKLEQYDYAGATAVAVVMLVISFILLLVINALQAWQRRHAGAQHERAPTLELFAAHKRGTTEAPWVRYTLIGAGAGLHAAVPGAAAGRRVCRGAAQGLAPTWKACASPMPGRPSS
jgi:predicted lysophospholipase L1 biosynthesis ABC-type transport system permease subunit